MQKGKKKKKNRHFNFPSRRERGKNKKVGRQKEKGAVGEGASITAKIGKKKKKNKAVKEEKGRKETLWKKKRKRDQIF